MSRRRGRVLDHRCSAARFAPATSGAPPNHRISNIDDLPRPPIRAVRELALGRKGDPMRIGGHRQGNLHLALAVTVKRPRAAASKQRPCYRLCVLGAEAGGATGTDVTLGSRSAGSLSSRGA